MSRSMPPNPSSRDESRHDEWIAVLVALLAMGGIFFWVMGRDPKFGKTKFSSPNLLPAPETSVSDDLNLSRTLEESLALPQGQTPFPAPRSRSGDSTVVFPAVNDQADSSSRALKPIWGITPFAFAPQDQATQTEADAGDTEQANQPEVEASPEVEETPTQLPETVPNPEAEQAAQPETEASPDAEQAAEPETEPSPDAEQAAQPETEPSPDAEQAAQPETEPSPDAEQAAQPETEPSPDAEEETATQLPIVVIPDVSEDYWAKDFINYSTQNNIVDPYPDGTFKPDQDVTRAEFATQLENAFAPKQELSDDTDYKDVAPDNPAQQEITDVTAKGFMSGYPGEIFRPEEAVPRVQVLVALASGLELQPPGNPEKVLQDAFEDADQIPEWAVEQVAAATEAGLVVNHPEIKTLNPNEPATRAEVSAMIYQGLVKSDETEFIPSDYIVKPDKGGILPF
ncbi:MAG: S-layer homology domain-containing protein [Cyanobacteria bacterium J06592_8]